jgi:hypothetical protein
MNIAIVGAGATMLAAPFDSDDWEVYTTGRVYGAIPRADVVIEIHEHCAIDDLRRVGNAYIIGRESSGADETLYPGELREQFGPVFTSSIAYLLALAIDAEPDVIGLWGIDMAADGEYGAQREHVLYMIGLARGRGIEVQISEGSLIMPPQPLYGIDPVPEHVVIIKSQLAEIETQFLAAETARIQARDKEMFLRGARDACRQALRLTQGG